jgi:hypothetical protein
MVPKAQVQQKEGEQSFKACRTPKARERSKYEEQS